MSKDFTVIGVVHLLPLPGSPHFKGDLQKVVERALNDANALISGGVDGIIIENFNDIPFCKDNIYRETLSAFTVIAYRIKALIKEHMLLGINVLRNDALSALSIANAVNANFIRINVPIGAVITPSGIVEGKISDVARKRDALGGSDIAFYEDVMVKHAWNFGKYDIGEWAIETEKRGLADAVIVSGKRTSGETHPDDVKKVKEVVNVPVFIGSGVTLNNVERYMKIADGAIVGTYFEKDGISGNPVEKEKVKRFISFVKSKSG